jgi:phosphoribosylamine--glycine ligase
VYVCDTLEQCQEALQEIFEANRFGASGQRVVVEERLHGPEVSLMVLSDGQTLIPLASSQDFKRRFDGNQGPNTGGMGSYSPVPNYSVWEDRVAKQVLTPLAEALRQADFTFKGLLYVGLMMVNDAPYILEFNARFGDPETQCLLPRLESDIVPLFWACVDGTLDQHEVIWHANAAVCVVLTADTYPQQGSSGEPITMPTQWPDDVIVFHAGTALNQDNSLVTQGGRILNVVGVGPSLPEATSIAYGAVDQIHFTGMACRTDIAKDVALCLSK